MAPIRKFLAESGISDQKWRELRVFDEDGPMEHSAIAHEACLTRMPRTMEAEGLVRRVEDEADRRRTIVTIAERGRAIIATRTPDIPQHCPCEMPLHPVRWRRLLRPVVTPWFAIA